MSTPHNPGDAKRSNATASRAYQAETRPSDNTSEQEAWLGTSSTKVSNGNVSWGAIFAGVFSFLALMVLLGLVAGAMGLQGANGVLTGIVSIIILAIAFAGAGYVSGLLGVRAGLIHGFTTWATSVVAAVILTGWLGASVLGGIGSAVSGTLGAVGNTVGAVGNGLGSAASSVADNASQQDIQNAKDAAQQQLNNLSQEDIQKAQDAAQQLGQQAQDAAQQGLQQAQDTAKKAASTTAAGAWWTVLGLIIGAALSAFCGGLGSKTAIQREEETVVRPVNS